MSDTPGNLHDVVDRRRAAYEATGSDDDLRRLRVAEAQYVDAPKAVVDVDNDVDLEAVVAARRAAVESDPSPRNQHRLAVAEAQLAEADQGE